MSPLEVGISGWASVSHFSDRGGPGVRTPRSQGLARALADGTRRVPDFRHALSRHRLIDAVERASATRTARTFH